jgi:hypothetical protein
MTPPPRQQGKTPLRNLRVEDSLWDRFEEAATELGTDRSSWLRDAIRWCLREPGVRAPRRLPVETQDPQGHSEGTQN